MRTSLQRMRQCLRRLPNGPQILESTSRIAQAYSQDDQPWVVGYSGGKDSTAVVKLVFHALLRVRDHHKPVTVLYCDTGVEIPMASVLARESLRDLRVEAREFDLPITSKIVEPALDDRFFVKVLGRGYPPPTDKFRWCTDRLRIDPVSEFLRSAGVRSAIVVLGVRESESATRSLTLKENETSDRYWRKQKGKKHRRLFMPIIDYSIEDVWLTNLLVERPHALRAKEVAELYVDASDECPTVRDAKGAPCGKARFGCWTCTVAKNGVTMRNLIRSGSTQLEPLLEFRLWLEAERNNPRYRWKRRRNGQPGPGPMTMGWRKLALKKLLAAQDKSGFNLISRLEIGAIHQQWRAE